MRKKQNKMLVMGSGVNWHTGETVSGFQRLHVGKEVSCRNDEGKCPLEH